VETIGSKRSYALIWCTPNNDDDDDIICKYVLLLLHCLIIRTGLYIVTVWICDLFIVQNW